MKTGDKEKTLAPAVHASSVREHSLKQVVDLSVLAEKGLDDMFFSSHRSVCINFTAMSHQQQENVLLLKMCEMLKNINVTVGIGTKTENNRCGIESN